MSPILRAAAAALLLTVPLVACDEGPAERMGARVDRAAEGIRDAVDPPQGAMERAGRAIDRATD